ncbi:hypothetical protein EVAR_89879_1 [Eumeta japonica]|uniref:Uncharacterized protein n=1 Tax=Eumeta variegata TaxID=151549 RepID=A0A4C1ZM61_EUMVA|nr:hypothetical protein EVAR_89879_1 [Eumeta japonica]
MGGDEHLISGGSYGRLQLKNAIKNTNLSYDNVVFRLKGYQIKEGQRNFSQLCAKLHASQPFSPPTPPSYPLYEPEL